MSTESLGASETIETIIPGFAIATVVGVGLGISAKAAETDG